MLEDPAAAVERIYHEMYARVEQIAGRETTVSTQSSR